ncbi:MAG: tetratricopeptide repeat protein, partial [Halioglobus sp.]|nr:tetratricopeptide repeat protein [Halioglobus sp.]
SPERVEGWINLGSMMVECRQLKAAINVLGQALQRQPDNWVSYMVMGDAQRLNADRDKALECYSKAVAINRAPAALNRLGSFLRHMGQVDEAVTHFDEAIATDHRFSLAQVNRATIEIDRGNFDEAELQLTILSSRELPPKEAQEVLSCGTAVFEYRRLCSFIDPLTESSDLAPLEDALRDLPGPAQVVDNEALKTIALCMNSTRALRPQSRPLDMELPDDWALLEALHMVPYVHSVDDYLAYLDSPPNLADSYDIVLHQSTNMEAAVTACRRAKGRLADPVTLETHLRHWHKLACNGVAGYHAGHFKYVRNVDLRSPSLPLVDPGATSSTFRIAAAKAYLNTQPGIERAAIAFLIVANLHLFGDGNGRVGMTWMNRELEWAGEMPVLCAEHLGLKGMFGHALRDVRDYGGDLTPMFDFIVAAQDYSKAFCTELAQKRRA